VTHRASVLDRVLAADPPPFAILHRPEVSGGRLDVLAGEVSTAATLADLSLPETIATEPSLDLLVLIPYRQIAERGFACTDDGAPLVVMRINAWQQVPADAAMVRIPDAATALRNGHFDVTEDDYAATVRRVVDEEIGRGEGANFVIKRSFTADISDYSPARALALFGRLLRGESGAYWTFIVHTGDRTLVGASPERHVSLSGGTAVMNPISGTYRYPPSGPTLPGVLGFLADRKEADELYMVVDEELKMMARICDSGARVTGPYLKEMARLAHTEYFIEGRTSRDVREILRETLFAPTVTGSPLENACQVIARYEPEGRGYYSGVVALIGRGGDGRPTMDSSILIRTADIDRDGHMRIGVGATLVRHSDPASEVAETEAKAAGLLAALEGEGSRGFGAHPEVRRALAHRNETISRFWLREEFSRGSGDGPLAGGRVLVVDAEDTFTSMIAHQLGSLGLSVTVHRYDEPYEIEGHDLVVMGPGPGDPRDVRHPKIAHLRSVIRRLLDDERPFLAVCLSHQVLCGLLGFEIVRREVPNQGLQKEIDLFGHVARVGFYNTFAARAGAGAGERHRVEISSDPSTGEVHALRAAHFGSMQFHAESVLTEDGPRILRDALTSLLRSRALIKP
jgi:2-amino-4-deoxychorismate synthase